MRARGIVSSFKICNVNVEIITSMHVLNKPEKPCTICFDVTEATCACGAKPRRHRQLIKNEPTESDDVDTKICVYDSRRH